MTHPSEPRSYFCRRFQVERWTGWSKGVINDLVATGVLRTRFHLKPHGRVGRRLFITHQVKAVLEGEHLTLTK